MAKRGKIGYSPDETPEQEQEPKNDLVVEYTGKYWKTSVFITGFGPVLGGKATEEQLTNFVARMNPETNLDDWLSDTDEYTAYIKKNTIRTGTSK